MCIAVPGLLVKIEEDHGGIVGSVEFNGVIHSVCLDVIPEARVGDYVLVYAGFARAIVTTEEADVLRQFNEEMAHLLEVEG